MLFIFITTLSFIILTGMISILMWIIGEKNDQYEIEVVNKNVMYYLEMFRAIFAILGIIGALICVVIT